MTVDQLIEKLAAIPGHYEVVVNASREYENYTDVTDIIKGEFDYTRVGGMFTSVNDMDPNDETNAVLLL